MKFVNAKDDIPKSRYISPILFNIFDSNCGLPSNRFKILRPYLIALSGAFNRRLSNESTTKSLILLASIKVPAKNKT